MYTKFLRRFFAIMLSLMMILSMSIASFAEMPDVYSHWAKNEIEYLTSKGVVGGYPDGEFKPDKTITRAEFFKIINNIFGYSEKVDISFNDVKDTDWYYGEIQKAVEAGYVNGYPDNTIRPNGEITRQEAAKVIAITFGLNQKSSNSWNVFNDYNDIASWARSYVGVIYDKGFVSGYKDKTYRPENKLTRAETIKIISNATTTLYNISGNYSEDSSRNVIVNITDVTLKDMTIDGDLYLTEGIGSGDVTIEGVTVKGKTFVRGGGENSIHIKNSSLTEIISNKTKGKVRIVLSGEITIPSLIINKNTIIIIEKGVIIKNLQVNGKADIQITKGATIENAVICTTGVEISGEGNISNLQANEEVKINDENVEKGKEVEIKDGEIVIEEETSTSLTRRVTGVTLNKTSSELTVGDTLQLIATVKPNNAENKKVTWSTSNDEAATVNNDGLVTAVGVGETIITVKTVDRSKIATCTVTVAEKALEKYSATFTVMDEVYNPITNAQIKIEGPNEYTVIKNTINEGKAIFNLVSGSYDYTVTQATYETDSNSFIISDIPIDIEIIMKEKEKEVSEFAGGDGSEVNPYQVANNEQLSNVRNYLDKHFIQIADIDLGVSPWNEGEGWEPISDFSNRFTGVFDGNGYVINNLTINRNEMYQGLFGTLSTDGIIKNIRLENADITGNCFVGGLVGYQFGGNIIDCSSEGTIKAYNNMGGLVGQSNGMITRCYTKGLVQGLKNISDYYFGGLAGRLANGASVIQSYSTATVEGDNAVGGLVGYAFNSTVDKSFAAGYISGSANLGGLVGKADGEFTQISNSYYDTDNSSQSDTGKGTPKTTEEMKSLATFVDWDFTTVWGINPDANDAYPFLRWQGYKHIPDFAGGTGTEEDPYQVATAYQLDKVRNYLDKHFIQIADIDLGVSPWNEEEGWNPIGSGFTDQFLGFFNGNGYKIRNLKINRPTTNYVGLFGVSGGVLQNIGLVNVDIIGAQYTGGMLGCTNSGGYNTGNYVTGNVVGTQYVGGLAGGTPGNNLQVTNSYASVNVQGNWGVGGLVGMMYGAISNSYATGNVSGGSSGSTRIGGLVGEPYGYISNCYSTGRVSCDNVSGDVGGLLGYQFYQPTSSYWDIDTSGQATSKGGIGKTTPEMQQQMTYQDWDFVSVWGINSLYNVGYPFLRWQGYTHLPTP